MYLYMIDLRVLPTPIHVRKIRYKILQCPKHDFSDPGIETAQDSLRILFKLPTMTLGSNVLCALVHPMTPGASLGFALSMPATAV